MKGIRLLFLILAGAVLIMQCGSSDEGGAGADFDASQYYTKAEVNNLILASREIQYANENYTDITAAGYENGAGPWATSGECIAIIFDIRAINSSATASRQISFAFGDSASGGGCPLSFMLSPGENKHMQAVIGVYSPDASTTSRLWVNGDYSNMTDVSLRVYPSLWLKKANF